MTETGWLRSWLFIAWFSLLCFPFLLACGGGEGDTVDPFASQAPSADFEQDLANFLLTRGPYAWLGWGWKGCSQQYYFPPEFNLDYGEPGPGRGGLCKETADASQVFTREYSKATVTMDCRAWKGTVIMK